MRTPTLGRHATNAKESAHPELWDGFVGAWVPALGVQGGSLFDVSGNGNHGTLTNMDPATDWVVREKDYVLDFDGNNTTDNQVEINDIWNQFPVNDTPFGIFCYFFSRDSTNQQALIEIGNGAISGNSPLQTGFRLLLAGDDLFGQTMNGSRHAVSAANIVTPNVLHDAVFNYDGAGNMEIFLDGVSVASAGGGAWNTHTVATIGIQADGSTVLDGGIGAVYLSNQIFSQNTISLLHKNPLAPFELKRRPVAFVPAVVAAGNPWYYYAQQAQLAGRV